MINNLFDYVIIETAILIVIIWEFYNLAIDFWQRM